MCICVLAVMFVELPASVVSQQLTHMWLSGRIFLLQHSKETVTVGT